MGTRSDVFDIKAADASLVTMAVVTKMCRLPQVPPMNLISFVGMLVGMAIVVSVVVIAVNRWKV